MGAARTIQLETGLRQLAPLHRLRGHELRAEGGQVGQLLRGLAGPRHQLLRMLGAGQDVEQLTLLHLRAVLDQELVHATVLGRIEQHGLQRLHRGAADQHVVEEASLNGHDVQLGARDRQAARQLLPRVKGQQRAARDQHREPRQTAQATARRLRHRPVHRRPVVQHGAHPRSASIGRNAKAARR